MSEVYKPPLGDRFSQLYVDRGDPTQDSKRLRNRLAAYMDNNLSTYTSNIAQEFSERMGMDIFVQSIYSLSKFVKEASLNDFLDSVKLVNTAILKRRSSGVIYSGDQDASKKWLSFCAAAFIEENSFYVVDSKGVCRPFVDDEFRRNVQATIAGLSHPK